MAKPKNTKLAPKKSKSTKKPRSAGYGGKSSFILSFPDTTPAAEIVEAGAAKGLKFNPGYVSTIRSLNRKRKAKAGGGTLKDASGLKRKGMAPSRGKTRRTPSTHGDDASLVQLVLRYGIAKVEEALARVKAIR